MREWLASVVGVRWAPSQVAIRLVALVLPVVALWLTAASGVSPDPKLVALVLLLSVVSVLAPESAASVVLLMVVLAWWGLAFRSIAHPWVIPAAGCLLGTHLCLLIAAYGPATMPVSRAVVLLWVRRGLLVFVPVPLLYLVAVWLRDQPAPAGMWVIGVGAVLVASVAATLIYQRDPLE